MGRLVPEASETTTSSATHLYPQALQLKLYQAFIFSIPILFSIILFLLFYLFYLKRRANSSNHFSSNLQQTRILSRTSTQPTPYLSFPSQLSLKVELKDKLPIVLFDEEIRTKDSLCCVCLGEFEMKEELLQVPLCKHVFHADCIHHWLHSNSTCLLCRCSVLPTTMSRMHSRRNSNHQPPQPLLQQTLATLTPEPSPPSPSEVRNNPP